MDLQDLLLKKRMMDIYRTKAALGGCDDYCGDGVYAGVLLGGASKYGLKPGQYNRVLTKFMKQGYGIKEAHKLTKQQLGIAGTRTRRKKQVKSRSKSAKPRSRSKRRPAYGYPPNPPTRQQLNALGVTRDEFLRDTRGYTKRQKQRVGHRYDLRSTNNRCLHPHPEGPFYLDEEYDCEPVEGSYYTSLRPSSRKLGTKKKNLTEVQFI